jgi:hypothetical protein
VTEAMAATRTPLCRTFLCLAVGNLSCFAYHLQLSTPKTVQDVATLNCHFPSARLVTVLFLMPHTHCLYHRETPSLGSEHRNRQTKCRICKLTNVFLRCGGMLVWWCASVLVWWCAPAICCGLRLLRKGFKS